jgi:hypothetical protein
MTALTIKDLATSTELDREAMASVSGGHSRYLLPLWGGPRYKAYNRKDVDVVNFTADQFIGQEQNVDVATGVNVAFADHIKSVVKPTQNANNNINFS